MPITQKRMLALITAADENESARRALLREFKEILESLGSGKMDTSAATAAFFMAGENFRPSEESVRVLAREREHFRHTAARNVREAEKAKFRRAEAAAGLGHVKGAPSEKRWGLSEEEQRRMLFEGGGQKPRTPVAEPPEPYEPPDPSLLDRAARQVDLEKLRAGWKPAKLGKEEIVYKTGEVEYENKDDGKDDF